ncbi:MAG: right-handed parallel beta-helix repeat-containing protein [Bacteroidaceae bacterium]|nr:right-handed parallel beta-helix repeat-containing protein [Bacteroidaceae bacterium]
MSHRIIPFFALLIVSLSVFAKGGLDGAKRAAVSPDNEDNTPALQALVDSLGEAGGGTIRLGVGTYVFRGTVRWRSGVSLEGENVQRTVLKMVGNTNWSLFIGESTAQGTFAPITSVRFEHFTVDGYAMNPKNYITNCKAFNIRPITDAVFNDLVLRGTPATSLGVDFLNRVLISNVRVIEGGRLWKPGNGGGSGIGIGLRGYDDENFIITNCVCVGCGNNGIFVEDQSRFGNGINGRTPMTEGKGQIIMGNIVKNGRNHGISVQGARHITITDNVVYDNAGAGFYGNYFMSDVLISGNQLLGNRYGVFLNPASNVKGTVGVGKFEDISILNNSIKHNREVGIYLTTPDTMRAVTIQGNVLRDNPEMQKIEGVVLP